MMKIGTMTIFLLVFLGEIVPGYLFEMPHREYCFKSLEAKPEVLSNSVVNIIVGALYLQLPHPGVQKTGDQLLLLAYIVYWAYSGCLPVPRSYCVS